MLIAFLIVGCARTVVPRTLTNSTASFDGGQRNSGILGTNNLGYWIITAHLKERCDALVKLQPDLKAYNGNWSFTPPVPLGYGMTEYTNGTWTVNQDGQVKYRLLNIWRKEAGK